MEREIFHSLKQEKRNYMKLPLIIAVGYILAMTELFGKVSPFPAAFLGSLSGFDCAAAFIGSIAGFLFKGDFVGALPPMISLAAVGLLRAVFARVAEKYVQIASVVLVSASVMLTNIAAAEQPTDVILSTVFAIIAGSACSALMLLYRLSREERAVALMKPSNTAAAGIVTAFGVAAFSSVSIGIFNLGIVVSGVLVSAIVYKFRFAGGAVLGIVCTFGMALAGSELLTAGLILCIGGVASGIFSHYGKVLQTATFLLACAVTVIVLGINELTLQYMADMLIAGVIFMALPANAIMKRFQPRRISFSSSDPSEIFANRLYLAGSTMSELRYAVEKTAETLDKNTNKDISWVYDSACDKVCRSCRYNMQCWGTEYNESVKIMQGLLKILRTGTNLTTDDLKAHISVRCPRKNQLVLTINQRYSDFIGNNLANRKIGEMRSVLVSQLSATEKMLMELSDEFSNAAEYDRRAAAKVESILSHDGLLECRAAVKLADGNMIIEAYGEGELACEAEWLCDEITEALQREFDLPDIVSYKGRVRITMFERATFAVRSASCQFSKGGERACGDYIESYIDGKGYSYTVLSDGMGSGSRARIDSAFACGILIKMLESGISLEAAIEVLNTSLLVKSTDESFATLDVCRIDLYTGKVDLYKAGASDTFVKSGGKLIRFEGSGLPVGISLKTQLESKSFTIGENDVIILTSDGAEISEKWLEQAMEKESNKDVDELVKHIASTAKFNCQKGREDDISVVAITLQK